jgi:hypothetical protein
MSTCTYLTSDQMDKLIYDCKELRKGHKLIGNRKNFTVIVDEEHHEIATEKALRNFLSVCVFPKNFRFFRNADKGVTINLD